MINKIPIFKFNTGDTLPWGENNNMYKYTKKKSVEWDAYKSRYPENRILRKSFDTGTLVLLRNLLVTSLR